MKRKPTQAPISTTMRDLLIEHMDGHPVVLSPRWHWRAPAPQPEAARIRRETVDGLIARGFLEIRVTDTGLRETVITKHGREALSCALARWADCMMEAFDDLTRLPDGEDSMSFLKMVDRLLSPKRRLA